MSPRCWAASSRYSVTACALVDAPAAYGGYETLYNRCRPCSQKGVFQLIFSP